MAHPCFIHTICCRGQGVRNKGAGFFPVVFRDTQHAPAWPQKRLSWRLTRSLVHMHVRICPEVLAQKTATGNVKQRNILAYLHKYSPHRKALLRKHFLRHADFCLFACSFPGRRPGKSQGGELRRNRNSRDKPGRRLRRAHGCQGCGRCLRFFHRLHGGCEGVCGTCQPHLLHTSRQCGRTRHGRGP
mgnify:CR=1 FL=1